MINLYDHQSEALRVTKDQNRVAYYHDMGLGKTFTGAEKMMRLRAKINLIICQKSKVDDWVNHFREHYPFDVNKLPTTITRDLTKPVELERFIQYAHSFDETCTMIGIINYDLVFRRPELKKLRNFTLMLDESSMIQNENAKRSKFILNLNAKNVILLSGTPTSGKYETLWSQLHLLGWNISKELYWRQYIDTEIIDDEGYPIKVVRGYKNVERLKRKLRRHGAHFLKTEEVFDLPEQIHHTINAPITREYRVFRKDKIVTVNDRELVGDTTLTKMLYERQLCGQYNEAKLDAFRDLLESTNDRLIVFYNFTAEMNELMDIANEEYGRPCSLVNGDVKNLEAYEHCEDSVTFIQYQAGAMGLNLQRANKIIYFTPPLSSELFEQSKKRVHRIGQNRTCFYYYLTCKNSIEEKIYEILAMRKDYTDALFEEERGE